MNRKEQYKDKQKWRKTCNKQKVRYYGKTVCGKRKWKAWQDELILKHEKTDHELSEMVEHSVKAIQVRRSRLKAGL